jgi:hypothetical protein
MEVLLARKTEKGFYTEVDQIADGEAFFESVRAGFDGVDDPRAQDNQTYPLVSLLVMMICAVLAGGNTILDIYNYAHIKLTIFSPRPWRSAIRRLNVQLLQAAKKGMEE